jgi:squalene-associated FAD-dependent desaturase
MQITLIDAAPQLGGRARTLETDMGFGPVRLDNGQHLMMGAYRETLALIARVSPKTSTLLRRSRLELTDTDGLSMRAAPLPAPWHLAAGFVTAKGLGIEGKLACARLMLTLRLKGWRVLPDETVSELLSRTGQPRWLIDRLWQPLCVSALNTPIDDACARTFAAVLRDTLGADRESSDFVLPLETLGDCLPEPASRWLTERGSQIVLRTLARSLHPHPDGWLIDLGHTHITARAVILALPPANSARLIAPLTGPIRDPSRQELLSSLQGFDPIPIATTYLAWPSSQGVSLPAWTMLSVQGQPDQNAAPGDWVFDRGIQQSHRIAAVVASAIDTHSNLALEPLTAAIEAKVVRGLRLPQPAHRFTVIERRATFACVPDRPSIAQPAEGNLPGLWLAGDYTERDYPATLEAAVRSGSRGGRLATDWLLTRASGAYSQAALRA